MARLNNQRVFIIAVVARWWTFHHTCRSHPPASAQPLEYHPVWQIHLARENQKLSFNFGSFNSVAPHPNAFLSLVSRSLSLTLEKDHFFHGVWTDRFGEFLYVGAPSKRQLVGICTRTQKNQWLIFFFAPQKDFLTAWWFGTCVIFQNIWDVILPIDELIFFKMVIAPPTNFIWHKTRPSHGIPPFLDTTFVCRRDFQRSDADPRGEIFR